MKDISDRKDIEKLVRSFYERVLKDDLISHFFTEVIAVDWEKHFPVMFDFWETTLLGSTNYKGNPMTKHFQLNEKEELKKEHFDRWFELWEANAKANFSGPKTDEAISRAGSIATLMFYKIHSEFK